MDSRQLFQAVEKNLQWCHYQYTCIAFDAFTVSHNGKTVKVSIPPDSVTHNRCFLQIEEGDTGCAQMAECHFPLVIPSRNTFNNSIANLICFLFATMIPMEN